VYALYICSQFFKTRDIVHIVPHKVHQELWWYRCYHLNYDIRQFCADKIYSNPPGFVVFQYQMYKTDSLGKQNNCISSQKARYKKHAKKAGTWHFRKRNFQWNGIIKRCEHFIYFRSARFWKTIKQSFSILFGNNAYIFVRNRYIFM